MYSHVARSETVSFWGFRRYRLTARIHPTPLELHIIERHGLQALEIFHDPVREQLMASAETSHDHARSRGLFVTKARDAISVSASEIRAAIAAVHALRSFNITVSDLVRGVSVTHKSLAGIREIEQAIVACIDHVSHRVQAARNYTDEAEDIFAPGADEPDTVPPADWTRTWGR